MGLSDKITRCSVVAKKVGCQLQIKLRRLKEGTKCFMLSVEVHCCAVLRDYQPKIQLAITALSAGEFRNNTEDCTVTLSSTQLIDVQ